jgi:hypothetical protein
MGAFDAAPRTSTIAVHTNPRRPAMSAARRIRRIRRAAVASAVAATALAAALSAAPANAAIGPVSARLTVAPNIQRYSVDVTGVIRMSQAEAQDLINKDYRVVWKLWGDDPVYNDLLFGPDPASITATSRGLEFHGARVTTGGVLDEDDSVFDDHDELFARIHLVKGYVNGRPGPTVKTGDSNNVGGYF